MFLHFLVNFSQTQFKLCDKIIHVFSLLVMIILEDGAEQEPPAAEEVGDNAGNDYQSEDFVYLEHDVLTNDIFISAWLVLKRVNNLLELWDIN